MNEPGIVTVDMERRQVGIGLGVMRAGEVAMIEPGEARKLAHALLQAADAAEGKASVPYGGRN